MEAMRLAIKRSGKEKRPVFWLTAAALTTCGLLGVAGCSSSASGGSTPAPKPPSANAGGPYTALPGAALSFSGAGSTDPQSSALLYAWNFGDNTTGTGVAPIHSYASVGSYTVTVKVTDTLGLSATANTTATIAAQAPAANAGGPYTSSVGTPVNFDGSGSTDPQGQTLTYAWDFGDGTTGSGVQQSHFYSTHGAYTVTLTVTDSTYNLTGKSTVSVVNGQANIQPMTNVVPGTETGYFADPYPIQTAVPNGSPVPSFAGTPPSVAASQILTCPGALQAGCFTPTASTIDPGALNGQISSFENLNAYQDSKGQWQMAATGHVIPPPGQKPWNVIVHAHPQVPYTGIPTAWIADAPPLVGSLTIAAPDNYDGHYFEDSGVLYLLYNTKNLSVTTNEDYIVAQPMLSATVLAGSPPVPLLEPEESDGGYNSEISADPGLSTQVKLVETGHIAKVQGKFVMAYSTGEFNMPNYKAGLAWSDTFLPPAGTYYKRAQKVDVAGVWGAPNHAEVAYLLQAQQPQWPNYVASQVLSPGVPSVVADASGNYHLFFAGYDPSDVLSPAPVSGYNGKLRRPYYVDLNVNIPSGMTVKDASPLDLASWITPVTTP